MNNFIRVAIWFICLMFAMDWALGLITMDSTIANIVGFALFIGATYISVKTKCFTSITFNTQKNEKKN